MAARADKKTSREEAKRQAELAKAAEKARKDEARAARAKVDVAGESKWTGEGGDLTASSGGPRAAAVLPDLPTVDESMKALLRKDRRNKALVDTGILVGLGLLVVVVLAAAGLLVMGFALQTIILALATAVMAGSSFLMENIGWARLA